MQLKVIRGGSPNKHAGAKCTYNTWWTKIITNPANICGN